MDFETRNIRTPVEGFFFFLFLGLGDPSHLASSLRVPPSYIILSSYRQAFGNALHRAVWGLDLDRKGCDHSFLDSHPPCAGGRGRGANTLRTMFVRI